MIAFIKPLLTFLTTTFLRFAPQALGKIFSTTFLLSLMSFLTKPFVLGVAVFIMTIFPDAIQYLMFHIGLIAVKVGVMLFSVLFPAVMGSESFGNLTENTGNIYQMYSQAFTSLPSEIVEMFAVLDVVSLLGIIISTSFSILLYTIVYKIVMRIT